MIKEHDIGGSGAVGLSMLHHEGEPPPCKPAPQPGERVIDSSEWYGYFKADGYTLRYLRVADAECNVHKQGSACWKKIEAALALKDADRPVCTGYDHIAELVGTDDVESVIAYPVEVSLFPRPTVEVLAGAAKCWAAQ